MFSQAFQNHFVECCCFHVCSFFFFSIAVFPVISVILYAGVLCVVTQRSSPSFTRPHKGAWSDSGSFRFCGRMCASVLRGSGSTKGEILAPAPSVPPPKKKCPRVSKKLRHWRGTKWSEVLAPSASHLKMMGGGGMIGRCKEVVFFALLVFIPTFPNGFLKVQS